MARLCDLCGGGDPKWDWLTPNRITQEEAEAGLGLYFEDPHWWICDTCHEMVLSERRDTLLQRAMLNLPKLPEAMFVDPIMRDFLDKGQRAEVARMHGAFWEYKTEFATLEA